MIACYAWTDTQIINLLQLCRSIFDGEPADLFVLKLERISSLVLEAAYSADIFHAIYEIPCPAYEELVRRPVHLPLFKTIHIGRTIQKYFDEQITRIAPLPEYGRVFVPGFWAETLHLLHALSRKAMVDVYFYEEGMFGYLKNSYVCRVDKAWKEKLERFLRYGCFYVKAKQSVKGIWLYRPEDMLYTKPEKRFTIPPLEFQSDFWRILFNFIIPQPVIKEYKSRRFIYLVAAPQPGCGSDLEESFRHIKQLIDTVGPENVVIRFHPAVSSGADALYEKFGNKLFVDDEKYWFEGLYALVDWRDKIITTRNSSILRLFLTMELDIPSVILTYKLYEYYKKNGDSFRDNLAEMLSQKTTTLVPESQDELAQILVSLIRGNMKA